MNTKTILQREKYILVTLENIDDSYILVNQFFRLSKETIICSLINSNIIGASFCLNRERGWCSVGKRCHECGIKCNHKKIWKDLI